jgi:hypothetical protein
MPWPPPVMMATLSFNRMVVLVGLKVSRSEIRGPAPA